MANFRRMRNKKEGALRAAVPNNNLQTLKLGDLTDNHNLSERARENQWLSVSLLPAVRLLRI